MFGSRARAGRSYDSPFQERGFVASGALMAMVVLTAVLILLMDGGPGGEGAAPVAGSASAGQGEDPPAVAPSAATGPCPSAPPVPAQAVAEPADVRWAAAGDVLLPFSSSLGPLVTAPIARCYARTTMGAVVAALQASLRYRAAEDDLGPVARHLLASGPGRDAFLARSAPNAATPRSSPPPAGQGEGEAEPALPYGFRVQDASADRVTVLLDNRPLNQGDFDIAVWTVVWQDGDWRLELPVGGEAPPQQSPGADGALTRWSLQKDAP